MTDREGAMLSVIFTLVGFMQREGIISRERLIDYFLETMAAPPQTQKGSAQYEMFQKMIDLLEHSQGLGDKRQ